MISNYDGYVYAIALLLPISASMLVLQTNPYNALVLRGILGSISALIYTILGAADVALTEALVGAFLATMLYSVAVRASLVLRLGVVEDVAIAHDLEAEISMLSLPNEQKQSEDLAKELGSADEIHFKKLINALRNAFSKHYMRVELVPFGSVSELEQALLERNVHATLDNSQIHNSPVPEDTRNYANQGSENNPEYSSYQIKIRLHRLYEIIQEDPILSSSQLANVQLIYQK
jgi:putative multicomponent Na+:H+ antiporter subunit B